MTRKEFEARAIHNAIRNAERRIRVPPGWWGTWYDVRGPGGWRVRWSRDRWIVSRDGKCRSPVNKRDDAIRKARRLAKEASDG